MHSEVQVLKAGRFQARVELAPPNHDVSDGLVDELPHRNAGGRKLEKNTRFKLKALISFKVSKLET